jgi:hypothetical protein
MKHKNELPGIRRGKPLPAAKPRKVANEIENLEKIITFSNELGF